MKIRKDNYQKILEYFIRKREEGYEFVAFFEDTNPTDKSELFFFSTQLDVQEFCYEMATDIDKYDYLAIRSAYRTMAEAHQDNSLMLEKDGVVDLESMVAMRYHRLETEKLNHNQNAKVMNEKNLEYLANQVKYTGFGEEFENELRKKIKKEPDEFSLKYSTSFGKDKVDAKLKFSKSKQTDIYFFNSYQLGMEKQNAHKVEQTFYINKGNNITLKEAYNLLSGRAVNKDLTNSEGQLYNAWVQLDFKETDESGNFKLKKYSENYGYDLESALENHPIKELNNEEYKGNLIDFLKKGNLQSATFINDGKEEKRFISANPKFKIINLFDNDIKRIGSKKNQEKDNKKDQTEKKGNTQKTGKGNKTADTSEPEAPDVPEQRKRKGKSQSA